MGSSAVHFRVEQWLACLAHNQEVEGSNPSSETIYDPIGSPLSPYFSTMVILNFTKKKLKKLSHKKLVKVCIEAIEAANFIAQQNEGNKNRGDAAIGVMNEERKAKDLLKKELAHKERLITALANS